MSHSPDDLAPLLARIATALERLAPPPPPAPDFSRAEAFVWRAESKDFLSVETVNRVDLSLLEAITTQRDLLFSNTQRFAQGFPANNALLWGARGMGKSSLVKAVHGAFAPQGLKLVEIHREDLEGMGLMLSALRAAPFRFIVFCDDLSFEEKGSTYRSLKTALEGGVEGRPENTLIYATSNRRHLVPRDMTENERATAIHPSEAIEENVSLSDRFGLWLGFHACAQDDYLAIVFAYAKHFHLDAPADQIRREALEWSVTRGARSGRVAFQYIEDLAGRLRIRLRA